MADFTLDTSGVVWAPVRNDVQNVFAWSDLSPFEQGYVEALFASLTPAPYEPWRKVKLTDAQRSVLTQSGPPHTYSRQHSSSARTVGSLTDRGLVTWCWGTPIDWAEVRLTEAGRAALNPANYERCPCGAPSHIEEAACVSCGRTKPWAQPPGFSDLAPEALATIRKGCADIERNFATWIHHTDMSGGEAWRARQLGKLKGFPPLTVTLADDGKVYLREAGA